MLMHRCVILKIKEEERVKDEPRCLAQIARWQLKEEKPNREENKCLKSNFLRSKF